MCPGTENRDHVFKITYLEQLGLLVSWSPYLSTSSPGEACFLDKQYSIHSEFRGIWHRNEVRVGVTDIEEIRYQSLHCQPSSPRSGSVMPIERLVLVLQDLPLEKKNYRYWVHDEKGTPLPPSPTVNKALPTGPPTGLLVSFSNTQSTRENPLKCQRKQKNSR